ncbi:MAG: 4-alpha-glucanotransferase, partial [Actinomycetota bacterium]|nr:4-alpha-glucanotransferase [Actinomycetota bacterium]
MISRDPPDGRSVASPAGTTLARLARAWGVETSYTDANGQRVEVSTDTVRAILGAMGVAVDDARAALAAAEHARWRRLVAASVVVRCGTPGTVLARAAA